MDAVWWILVIVSAVGTAAALWRSRSLTKELQQIKRAHYYHESRLKRVPHDIHEAVQPIRWQLINITSGKPVLPELISSGRLYVEISAEDAQRMIEQSGGYRSDRLVILDVRTPKEFAAKHIAHATLLPFEELDRRYRAEVPDTKEKIIVYCSSGERSRLACDFLGRAGYTNLYHMQAGLGGWSGPTEGEGEVTFIKLERRR